MSWADIVGSAKAKRVDVIRGMMEQSPRRRVPILFMLLMQESMAMIMVVQVSRGVECLSSKEMSTSWYSVSNYTGGCIICSNKSCTTALKNTIMAVPKVRD